MDAREIRNSSSIESRKLPTGESISLATICLDSESLSQLRHLIDSSRVVRLGAELNHYFSEKESLSLVNSLKDRQPDIFLIDFDQDRERASLMAERIHEMLPEAAIFATSLKSQPDQIIRAMRSGCTEYLVKPVDSDELLEALARVAARKREKPEQKNAQILTFLGAKGGLGVTTLAIHLAVLLKKTYGKKTLLIDYHPDLGDAALYLSLEKHQYHFYELADNIHRLDSELLQGFLVRHSCGLEVLPAPDGFEAHRLVSQEAVAQTLEFLRTRYDFVVVDCPPSLNEHNMAVLQESDQVFLVAAPEIPAVRNIARYLDHLNRYSYPPERVRIIINRYSKKQPITIDQIEKAVRKKIFWMVPNQYAEVIKVINMGAAGSGEAGSEFMLSMASWAETLMGKTDGTAKKKESKGMLGLWGS